MKKTSIKNMIANNVAKFQDEGNRRKNAMVKKIKKYVYTEQDLGEGLLYMGLSTPVNLSGR